MAESKGDNDKMPVSELEHCSLSSSTSKYPSSVTIDKPIIANTTDEQTTKAEKEKQRKQAHEKARKARRKAEAEEVKNNPPPLNSKPKLKNPEWVKAGRSQARKDVRSGRFDPSRAYRLQFRILNDTWIPGIGALIMSTFQTFNDAKNAPSGEAVAEKIKHAIKFGVKDEAKMIAKAKSDYVDDASRFARERKPLMRVAEDIYGAELAVFRRCYPIGSSTEDWHLVVEPTVEEYKFTEFSINILLTPFLKTDGSVEEALYTVAMVPLNRGPSAHITLPMFRKAVQDVERGDDKWPFSFDYTKAYRAKNATQLARWAIAFAPTLNEEQKKMTLDFADKFWNKARESFLETITGQDRVIDASPGQTQAMSALIFGLIAIETLGLENNPNPSSARNSSDQGATLESYDRCQWYGMTVQK